MAYESTIWKDIAKSSIRGRRIEGCNTPGFPDMILTHHQIPILVEAKTARFRPNIPINIKLRAEQVVWHHRWFLDGGLSFIMVWDDNAHELVTFDNSDILNLSKGALREQALLVIPRQPGWPELFADFVLRKNIAFHR